MAASVLARGRDNVRDFLKKNEDAAHSIDTALRDLLLPGRRGSAEEAGEAVEA